MCSNFRLLACVDEIETRDTLSVLLLFDYFWLVEVRFRRWSVLGLLKVWLIIVGCYFGVSVKF